MNRKERKARIRAKQLVNESLGVGELGSLGVGRCVSPGDRSVPATSRGGKFPATEKETRICARALKRERAFAALCEKEGIRRRPLVLKNANPRISPQMMKWRRITSITLRLEPFMDDLERKAGLERLVGWLELAYSKWKKGAGECGLRNSDCGLEDGRRSHDESGVLNSNALGSLHGQPNGRLPVAHGDAPMHDESGVVNSNATGSLPLVADATHPSLRAGWATHGRQDAGDTAGGTPALQNVAVRENRMIHADWNSSVKSWARVRQDGFSVESVCANLGISRWKLTQLVKEHCNLTANELIDGFKLKHLKALMLERLRMAARELWGPPGHYAQYKTEGFLNCEGEKAKIPAEIERGGRGVKRSEYFKTRVVDLFNELPGDERIRRTGELIARMWRNFDLESWAVSAGFASAGRLKRAVLMVLGKSLDQMEKTMATEVIDYYRCAEDRELRNLALRENTCVAVFRAREMYHGKEDPPTEPFLDGWSAAEFGEKEWVERMMEAFG